MPVYRVRGPDGTIYRVQGPAGAKPEQITSFVASQVSGQAPVSSRQATPRASAETVKRNKYLDEYAASQKRQLDETLRVSKLPGVTTSMRENASGRIEEYRKTLADIANEKDYMQRTGTLVPERSFGAAAIDQLKGLGAGAVRTITGFPSFLGAVGIESPGKASEAFGERIIQEYLAPDESDAAKFATFAQQGRRLSEAAGSVAPAVLTRGASRAGMALAGPRAVPAIARVEQAAQLGLGAGTGAQQQRQAIEQYEAETGKTVNPVVRAFAQALGVGIGATEVLTLDAVMARVPSSMRGSMTAKIANLAERVQVGGMSPKAAAAEARALVADIQKTARGRVGVATFEEGVQEGGAKLAQNVVERGLYNPEKDVTEGVGEEAMYGAIVGGGLRGGVELTNVLGKRAADNRKKAFEQTAAANEPLEEFDVNVGSYEDPSQLTRQKIQRISEPDANGDVFARRADGTIYQTSLKELYRMRAPTEGIRAVPIPDTLSAPALTQRLTGALGNAEPDSDMQSYINSVTTTLNNNMALGTPEKTETYLQKQQNGLRRARLPEEAKIARMLVLDEAVNLNNEYVGLVTAPPEGAAPEGTAPDVDQPTITEPPAPPSDEEIQSQIDTMRGMAAKRTEALNTIASDPNYLDKVETFEALMVQNGFDAPTPIEVASLYDAMRAESDAETAAGEEEGASKRQRIVDRANIIERVLYDDRISADKKEERINAKMKAKDLGPLSRYELERIAGVQAANDVFGPEGEYTERRQALFDQVVADPTITDKYRGYAEALDQFPELGDPTVDEIRILRGDAAPLEAQIAPSAEPITTAQLPAEPGGLPEEGITTSQLEGETLRDKPKRDADARAAINEQIKVEQDKLANQPHKGTPAARKAINAIKALEAERAAIRESAALGEAPAIEEVVQEPVQEEALVAEEAPVAQEAPATGIGSNRPKFTLETPTAEVAATEEVTQEEAPAGTPVELVPYENVGMSIKYYPNGAESRKVGVQKTPWIPESDRSNIRGLEQYAPGFEELGNSRSPSEDAVQVSRVTLGGENITIVSVIVPATDETVGYRGNEASVSFWFRGADPTDLAATIESAQTVARWIADVNNSKVPGGPLDSIADQALKFVSGFGGQKPSARAKPQGTAKGGTPDIETAVADIQSALDAGAEDTLIVLGRPRTLEIPTPRAAPAPKAAAPKPTPSPAPKAPAPTAAPAPAPAAPATEQPAPTATKQTINNPEEDISPVEEQLEADPTTIEGAFPASLNRPRAEAIGFAADLDRRVKSMWSRSRRKLEGKYKTAYDYSRALSAAYGVTKLPADLDVARKFELLETRKIGGQMRLNRWYLQPIEDKVVELGVDPDDAAMYLWARSAPARNALVRERTGMENGSGMSDAQAQAKLDELELEGLGPKLREVAKLHDALVDYMGNQRVKAGLLSKADWKAWRKAQPFYTPLKGYALDGDMQVDGEPNPHSDEERGIAKKNGTRIREALTTRGRKSIPFNPLYNLMTDAQSAIARIEQNKVKQTFLNNILSDPKSHEDLVTVYTPKKKTYPNGHVTLPKIGPAGPVDMNQIAAQKDANLMIVKKDGEPYYIEFAETPAGNALYRLFGNMTPRLLDQIMHAGYSFRAGNMDMRIPSIAEVGGFLKSMKTRYSPVFTFGVSWLRDFAEALATARTAQGIKGGPAEGTKLFKRTLRNIAAVRSGMGTISNYLRGKDPTTAEGELMALLFDQFLEDGGAVGHAQIMDAERYAQDAAKTIRRYAAAKRANPIAAALLAKDAVAGALDHASQLFDLHARFATYRAALEVKISREDAAALALDSTLDMTRRGEMASLLDSWSFFFSPTVGGTRKLLSQGRYSTIARKLFTKLVGAGMLLYLFNRFGPGAGDDDEDGRPNILEVNNVTAQTRVIFRYGPGINDYASIPTAFGIGYFNYMGGQLMAMFLQDIEPMEAATNIVTGFVSMASPIKAEGTEGLSAGVDLLVPDVGLQPLRDLMANRNAFGSQIYTPQGEYSTEPKSELGREETGKVWKFIARGMNSLFGGTDTVESAGSAQPEQYRYIAQQVLGGAYGFGRDTLNLLTGEAKPDKTLAERTPIVSTYFGKGGEYVPMDKFYRDYDKLRSIHSTYKKSDEEPEAWAENEAAFPVQADTRVMDAFDTALSEIQSINKKYRAGEYASAEDKYDALNDVYKAFNQTYSEVKKEK